MGCQHVESVLARDLVEADVLAIAGLQSQVWPDAARSFEQRVRDMLEAAAGEEGPREQLARYFLIRGERDIVAVAHVFPREILTTVGRMTIMGLAGVCVAAAERGRRLGHAVVEAALDRVDRGVFPFALFQTTPEIRPFYEKLGACVAGNRFVNSLGDDPDRSPFWDNVILRYPDKPGWPEGPIDMLGPGY